MPPASRGSEPQKRRSRPATTPEGREKQLIALAYDAAEEQIRSGQATSQLLTHFLKQATRQAELDILKAEQDLVLSKAKVQQMESGARVEELYEDAIKAMRKYAGDEEVIVDDGY